MSKTKGKTRKNPPVEIRPHRDSRTLIDEIIAEDVKMVHIEQMDDSSFWMSVSFNNSDKRLTVWFTAEDGAKIAIKADVEDNL